MTTMTDAGTRVTAGVDTHRDVHLVAALDERGGRLGVEAFTADAVGYRKSLRWLRGFGTLERVGVEGTGTYGAGLARYLAAQGVTVVEVTCPNRQRRRSHGKSDPVDALSAARAAQGGEATAEPKARTGNVEAIRALRVARRSATKARNDALNQMRALLVTGPEELRAAYRGTSVFRMVAAAVRLRPSDPTTPAGATKFALRELARRVQALDAEVDRLDAVLVPLVTVTAPDLIARHGVGPETAGALLVAAGDNPERLHSEAAFAHLCGSSPIDASSGSSCASASTVAVTAGPTRRCGGSSWCGWCRTPGPATTSSGAPRKACPSGRSSAASSATSPESSTPSSLHPHEPLDNR
jgi:transposase